MPAPGWLQTLWMTRFSRPAGERPLWRHVLRKPPGRILEIGLGTLARTERLIRLAAALRPEQPIQFVGIDRFESRTPADPPGVSLKEAHRRLTGLGRVQLVPGRADAALARVGNHIGVFDLVLVSSDETEGRSGKAWFFLQRLVRPESTVFVAEGAGATWSLIGADVIERLATRSLKRAA